VIQIQTQVQTQTQESNTNTNKFNYTFILAHPLLRSRIHSFIHSDDCKHIILIIY